MSIMPAKHFIERIPHHFLRKPRMLMLCLSCYARPQQWIDNEHELGSADVDIKLELFILDTYIGHSQSMELLIEFIVFLVLNSLCFRCYACFLIWNCQLACWHLLHGGLCLLSITQNKMVKMQCSYGLNGYICFSVRWSEGNIAITNKTSFWFAHSTVALYVNVHL